MATRSRTRIADYWAEILDDESISICSPKTQAEVDTFLATVASPFLAKNVGKVNILPSEPCPSNPGRNHYRLIVNL